MNSTVTYHGQLKIKPRFAKINSIFSGSARIIIVLINTVSHYGQFLPCLTRKNEREEMTTLVTQPPLVGPCVRNPFLFGSEGIIDERSEKTTKKGFGDDDSPLRTVESHCF